MRIHISEIDAAAHLLDPYWLAAALQSYEAEEDHFADAPGESYYPQVTPEHIQECLAMPHCGDCTKQPQPCLRCHAEHVFHKAKWLIEKAKEEKSE